jgi:hypothetical protein
VRAGGGVAVDIVRGGRGHPAADGLHDERDDVAGDKDPEVEAWTDDGGFAAQQGDEAAEEDVDACCEEGWCCLSSVMVLVLELFSWDLLTNNQRGYLHQKGSHVIGTLRRPCARSPPQDFGCWKGTWSALVVSVS